MEEYTQNKYYYKDMPVSDVFHIYSDGNRAGELMTERTDFIMTMNLIPQCALVSGITIYAFTIMGSHIHFIASGSITQCRLFCMKLARGMAKRLQKTDRKDVVFSIDPIHTEREEMTKICYVLLNTLDADQTILPFYYEWSTNELYFNSHITRCGTTLSSFSYREKRSFLHSDFQFPDNWLVSDEGMLFPVNYVDYQHVNQLFGTAGRFLAFFHQPKKDRLRLTMGLEHNLSMWRSDKDLRALAGSLSERLLGKTVRQLDNQERVAIARELLVRYYTSPKQAGRILHIDHKLLSYMI